MCLHARGAHRPLFRSNGRSSLADLLACTVGIESLAEGPVVGGAETLRAPAASNPVVAADCGQLDTVELASGIRHEIAIIRMPGSFPRIRGAAILLIVKV